MSVNGCKLQLSGPLPKNIANKESLQEIKVEGNFVSDFAETAFCSLTLPRRFHACLLLQIFLQKLLMNLVVPLQLTGSIPEEITRMPNLWRLRLQNNRFSGKLPASFRYSNLFPLVQQAGKRSSMLTSSSLDQLIN